MLSSTFILTVSWWQDLAKQVVEQAEYLRQIGEGPQLSADQAQQLQKIAALERSSQEQLGKINLLEARVETLEQDKSALKDKVYKLEGKVKTAAKEKKGIFFFLPCSPSGFLQSSRFPWFDRA